MSSPGPGGHAIETGRHPWSPALAGLGLLVVLIAGLNKALLFRNLSYYTTDLFAFLEMTKSWLYAGGVLHDNAFGFHGAIHNFYGLLAFAPLTIAFGAYGLILGLVLVHAAAVLRVASSAVLDFPARLMVLAGVLGPVPFYVFDDIQMGFHPELLYPPLALLLAVELIGGWSWRGVVVAGAIVLVKEDGAIVCAAIVLAHTAWRVGALRHTSKEEAWRALRSGVGVLLVLAVVFLAGMALLGVMSEHYSGTQQTFMGRAGRAMRRVARAVSGQGPEARVYRIRDAFEIYAAMSLLMLLPLGRRLLKGVALFAVAVPPILIVLVGSSAIALFNMMLWSPRIATLQAAVVAALVFAAVTLPGQRPVRAAVVVALTALSWAGQAAVLHHMQYPMASRWAGLASLARPAESSLSSAEDGFLRCVAGRLSIDFPMSVPKHVRPIFHRQSLVFGRHREARAWHPTRLRIVSESHGAQGLDAGFCTGPSVGDFVVQAECDLVPRLIGCGPGTDEPARDEELRPDPSPQAPAGGGDAGFSSRSLNDDLSMALSRAARAPMTPSS